MAQFNSFMAEWCSVVYMYHIFFIHSSVHRHLGCFHLWAIVNSAAMNIGVLVSFLNYGFLQVYARSGIAGSFGSSILSFFKEPLYCSP